MRNLVLAVMLALGLTATALAYPPATIEDATQTSITIGNLDCGTSYRIQVEEWRGGAWQDAQSHTQATDACPQAPPTADFAVRPSPSSPGQQVTLDWTGTCDAAPCSFAWKDEGSDGIGGTSWNLGITADQTFTFRSAGTKHIHLTVTDSLGRSATSPIRQHVVANAPPPPPPPARCADGQDNDADGAVDMADPGCTSSADDDETNVVSPPPSGGGFPNPATTGVPDGWTPTTTRTTNLTVTTPGTVIQDVLFANGADLRVAAANVTVRRSKFEGGWIDNNITNQPDGTGLLVEDVSMAAPDHAGGNFQEGAISYGGYTARRVEITGRSEGFRASSGGPVTIEDSFVRLHPPEPCGDWHGDGIQGYNGSGLTVRNVTLDMSDHTTANGQNCYGTAPFFYEAGQGNTGRVDVDRLLVEGMGHPFRLGLPGSVTGLKIVDRSWVFSPTLVSNCSQVVPWEAKIVTRDAAYQPTTVRDQPCRNGN